MNHPSGTLRRLRVPAAGLAAALSLALASGAVPATGVTTAPQRANAAAGQGSVGSPGWGDDYFPLDGNGGLDVVSYEIRDRYRFGSGRLSGTTRIVVRATQDLRRFNLDLLLPVRRVRVDGADAEFTKPRPHELRITPAEPLVDGQEFTVWVKYAGEPGPISYEGEANWLADDHEVVAMNQPHMAPWWFPSNDHPADKALMDISITVPKGKRVFANGRRVSRTVKGRLATTRFVADEPMTTYLAFFAAGSWRVATGERGGLPWTAVVSRRLHPADQEQAMRLMKRTPDVVSAVEEDLGDYPFSVVGGLTTALPVWFALENQTMPTYPVLSDYYGLSTVVHEVAHQWFGDHVAIERWRDIWLNEGAATFMEWRYAEQHGGQSAEDRMRGYYAKPAGDRFWDLEIGDPGPDHIFAVQVYYRGAMVFQALRNRIGENAFWGLLRAWIDEHGGGNSDADEFVALAEQVSGEDLASFFEAWLEPGKPADTAANGLG